MRYVRFQGLQLHEGLASKSGIFHLAYELRQFVTLTHYHNTELCSCLSWFNEHLEPPYILGDPKNRAAICWFKDCAHEPLKRIWAIKFLLEEYGIWVESVTVKKPGYILYEDEWQVAARPFKDTLKG